MITKEKVKGKCKEAGIFEALVGDDSEEWNELFDEHIEEPLDIKSLDDVEFEPKYDKNDLDAEVDFINGLENNDKYNLINLIEHDFIVEKPTYAFTKEKG